MTRALLIVLDSVGIGGAADAADYGDAGADTVQYAVNAPVKIDPGLRAGLTFMTLHFPDEVETNILTIDAVDPKSGTAEFKAAAVRIEKIAAPEPVGAGGRT